MDAAQRINDESMNKKIAVIVTIIIVLIAAAFLLAYLINQKSVGKVTNFEQCAKFGFPIMESYPRQCRAGDKIFIEDISANKSDDGNKNTTSPECKIAGCSGQLCVGTDSPDIITTCEYRQEYACYKTARCEKQSDGNCGWTQTKELLECISQFKNL